MSNFLFDYISPTQHLERDFEQDGLRIRVKRSHGRFPTRTVVAIVGNETHSEFVQSDVWDGHCLGHLWLPDFIKRAKTKLNLNPAPQGNAE